MSIYGQPWLIDLFTNSMFKTVEHPTDNNNDSANTDTDSTDYDNAKRRWFMIMYQMDDEDTFTHYKFNVLFFRCCCFACDFPKTC